MTEDEIVKYKEGIIKSGDVVIENFEEKHTDYTIMIMKLMDKLKERYGGRYLTVVMFGNTGYSYPLNLGYKHWSYVAKCFALEIGDAKIIANKLNEYFDVVERKELLKELEPIGD